MSKVLLLDRDGVINHKSKHTRYVETWDDFIWIDENITALQQLSQLGFTFIVITNQAGIGRGVMRMVVLDMIHSKMKTALAKKNILIRQIYVCPHHPDNGCACRKPKPGMINAAIKEHSLNTDQLCFVGDSVTDCQAASRAGIKSMYLGNPEALDRLADDDQPVKYAPTLQMLVDGIDKLYH